MSERWQSLFEFRDAALSSDIEKMKKILENGGSFISNENPDNLPLERFAKVYALQKNAGDGNLGEVKRLVREDPTLVHQPWTVQRWLPLSQAIWSGRESVVRFLLANGADPSAIVGDPEDCSSILELAKSKGNKNIEKMIKDQKRTYKNKNKMVR